MTARRDRSGGDTIAALAMAAKLYNDQAYQELGLAFRHDVRKLTAAAVTRFEAAGYEFDEALVALSYGLAEMLAFLERDTEMTPGDLGRLVAAALRKERNRKGIK
jgi:hypothetical protein